MSRIPYLALLAVWLFGVCLCLPLPAQNGVPQPPAKDSVFAEARTLLESGHADEAIAKLKELQARAPQTKGLWRELAIAQYRKGDYVAAILSFNAAIAEDPSDKESTQLAGLSYYLTGKPAQAIPLLEKVQTWYPRANIDASYILGVCYIQSKDYEHARGAFGRMFDVAPDSAASYLFTARMLMRQEFDPVAEEFAKKATTLDAKLPLAHFLLGELYLYKSRVPEAVTEFEQELKINPAHSDTLYKLADAYSRVERYDDAERLLQRSIWLNSTSTGPFILMGKVLQKKGEYELAARALQRAISMDPNNPIPHHLLGQTYRDMGKKQEAESELKLAEQLRTKQDSTP